MAFETVTINDRPELLSRAAAWFHGRWGIPEEEYAKSMESSLTGASVPRWYVVLDGERVIAGAGVIENDFHDRPDLSPNVCALYVEEDMRRRGVAGGLLGYICGDMKKEGIDTLYLLTDHTGFYERYGWEFFCTVQSDGDKHRSRMYIHR